MTRKSTKALYTGTHKFSVKLSPSKRSTRLPQKGLKSPKISQNSLETFFSSSILTIPACSEELQEFINALNASGDRIIAANQSPRQKRQAKNNAKVKNMNGFIAFRSYYANKIDNQCLQVDLSRKMGEFWMLEPHQDTWKRFAFEYNQYEGELGFNDWLSHKIGEQQIMPSSIFDNLLDITWSRVSHNEYFTYNLEVSSIAGNNQFVTEEHYIGENAPNSCSFSETNMINNIYNNQIYQPPDDIYLAQYLSGDRLIG